MAKYPFVRQHSSADCGAACIAMICEYYGVAVSSTLVQYYSFANNKGLSLEEIEFVSDQLGFEVSTVQIPLYGNERDPGLDQAPLPAILYWNENHYVVLYELTTQDALICDPSIGLVRTKHDALRESWFREESAMEEGIVVLFDERETLPSARTAKFSKGKQHFLTLWSRIRTIFPQSIYWTLGLLFLSLILMSLLTSAVPILGRLLVDEVVRERDFSLLWKIALLQILAFGIIGVYSHLQSIFVLYVGTKLNLIIITDFFQQLMKLPVRYFASTSRGEIIQRIDDNVKVEAFITQHLLTFCFALAVMFACLSVCFWYSIPIGSMLIALTVIYIIYVVSFMRRRETLEYKEFSRQRDNKNEIIDLVTGIETIKVLGSENQRITKWVSTQVALFKTRMSITLLESFQQNGATLIKSSMGVVVISTAILFVLDGQMSLGELLAIQLILVLIDSPLSQIPSFVKEYQEAKISYGRITSIYELPHESEGEVMVSTEQQKVLSVEDVSFGYSPVRELILEDVSLSVRSGQTIAIVGESGCGKSTFLKLLLRLYDPMSGTIKINNMDISHYDLADLRQQIALVSPDGYIFSDTILNNICEGSKYQKKMFDEVCEIANLCDLIAKLPKGVQTDIGADAYTPSSGEKQRILIARALYRRPSILLLDEATNALDANNELFIIDKIKVYAQDIAVIVVAHRLNTIENVDRIFVLHDGRIIEEGTINELLQIEGSFNKLYQNQVSIKS